MNFDLMDPNAAVIKIRNGVVFFLLILTSTYSFALSRQEARVIFEEANMAFDEQSYAQAISKYEMLVKDEYTSMALYHNLGLSYYEAGNLAKAILFMERAKRLAPMNKDVNHNLKLLKENVDGSFGSLPEFFLLAWYNNVVRIAPSVFWLVLHIIFLLAGLFLLYMYLVKGSDYGFHHSYVVGVIISLVVLSLLFAAFSHSAEFLKTRKDIGVVMNDQVALRAGAEDNSQEEGRVNQGVKVFIKDQIGHYLKVQLEDLTEAWIDEGAIMRI